MRLDRILSVYWFYLLRRLARRENGLRIPILMYHSVSGRDECSHHPYYETNVRPEVFIRQMQYLADRHFRVIPLSEAVSMLTDRHGARPQHPEAGHPPTKAYCVLTFDDGFRDFFHTAWPILERFEFASTVFLPTGRIADERQEMGARDCLTWGEVKKLAAEGVEFGAHTVSHVQLYDLMSAGRNKRTRSDVMTEESALVPSKRQCGEGTAPIEYELRESKKNIEENLGKPVSHYSYAYAFPEQDRAFVGMYETALRQAGYRAAVSTRVGTARHGDNPYTLRRIPVNSYDDPLLFRAKLAGAYDWLARPQLLSKQLRAGRAC
jgi:peptidoglycan/xylan/chitin deacetylase (PgdA/CDA1 family)